MYISASLVEKFS